MMAMRVLTLVLSLLVAICNAASVKADYPDRPVRIVVPVAAGGGVDVMARMLARKLSERWNQQFVVENRPGAAGIIGSKAVISSPPDGHTLLYTPSVMGVKSLLMS
jgi:tripartite-type tricarboxylate transporter receptor subunit TctC